MLCGSARLTVTASFVSCLCTEDHSQCCFDLQSRPQILDFISDFLVGEMDRHVSRTNTLTVNVGTCLSTLVALFDRDQV